MYGVCAMQKQQKQNEKNRLIPTPEVFPSISETAKLSPTALKAYWPQGKWLHCVA